MLQGGSSTRTMALASTQPLTEMSTRNLPGTEGLPTRKADNFNAICEPIVENVGASTSHYPMGLHGLLTGITLPSFLPVLNNSLRTCERNYELTS
jgi:hypothetical protein